MRSYKLKVLMMEQEEERAGGESNIKQSRKERKIECAVCPS